MEIIREKEFVNQYHFDARNHEWEKENGVPVTKLNVDFQLLKHSREENKTSMITILRFMIVLNQHVISGAMSQAVHLQNRFVEEPGNHRSSAAEGASLPVLKHSGAVDCGGGERGNCDRSRSRRRA